MQLNNIFNTKESVIAKIKNYKTLYCNIMPDKNKKYYNTTIKQSQEENSL